MIATMTTMDKKRIKDEVIEILEGLDMEVIYEFDRLHENTPDIYWAASKPTIWISPPGTTRRMVRARETIVSRASISSGIRRAAVSP